MTNERKRTASPSKKKIPAPRNDAARESGSPADAVMGFFKGAALTAGFGILLLIAFSLIAYFSPDPGKLIRPLALLASALTACAAGFSAIRIRRQSALLCGLIGGGVMSVLMLLISLFLPAFASGYSAAVSCLLHAGVFLFAILGAYLGLPRQKTRKRKRR